MKARFSLLLVFLAAITGAGVWARNAPDFALPTPDGKQISLSAQRGKFVVVEFLQPT